MFFKKLIYAHDMIIYIEYSKGSISGFSKVVGYKSNTEKSITLLYIKYKYAETEIKNTFYNCSKEIDMLRYVINRTFIGSVSEKYKILLKQIKQELNKWGDIVCS